jgi:ATP-dependent Lhr-like helicase
MSVFELLPERIRRLVEERGFISPTDPQAMGIEPILSGKNVLIIAPTGTGKTEAAILPILSKMPGGMLLYITPLRALNRDLMERISWWANKLDLRVSVRHGDTPKSEREAQRIAPPDILVTTPETLQIMLMGRKLREILSSVKYVVVDEVHELASSKRGAQLSLALERLRDLTGGFQIVGLSATVGNPDEVARFLVGSAEECVIVDVSSKKSMSIEVVYPEPSDSDRRIAERIYLDPDVVARMSYILKLMDSAKSMLIFVNTRPMSEILGNRFKLLNSRIPVEVHHGSLSAEERRKTEEWLKSGRIKAVICTSSLELGIDVGTVEVVVQYNSPRQVSKLIQRVGRSGHKFYEVSRGFVLVINSDDALETLSIARRALNGEVEAVRIPKNPMDALMHEIAGLLLLKARLTVDEIAAHVRRSYNYRDMSYDDLIKLLEFIGNHPARIAGFNGIELYRINKRWLYKYFFDEISMIPDTKQYLVVEEREKLPVGLLDEPFVAEKGKPGERFILSGRAWEVVSVNEGVLYAREVEESIGAVPSWIGEEIPVPKEIAEEVGRIRRFIEENREKGIERISEELSLVYPADKKFIERAIKPIYIHSQFYPVPTDKRIVLEKWRDLVIIHITGGTLINRAIARYLAAKLPPPVAVSEDPYRIYIKAEHIRTRDVISELSPENFGEEVRKTVESSGLFKFRFLHTARKMGIIEKGADVTSSILEKLIISMRDSVPYMEAFNYTIDMDMDVRGAEEILRMVKRGAIEVVDLGDLERPTPIADEGIRWQFGRVELIKSDKKEIVEREKLRMRLLSRRITLICTSCLSYADELIIGEIDEPVCKKCGSRRLAPVKMGVDEAEILLMKARDGREDKELRKARKWGKIVEKGGKKALIAYSAGLSLREAEEAISADDMYEFALKTIRKKILRRYSVY